MIGKCAMCRKRAKFVNDCGVKMCEYHKNLCMWFNGNRFNWQPVLKSGGGILAEALPFASGSPYLLDKRVGSASLGEVSRYLAPIAG